MTALHWTSYESYPNMAAVLTAMHGGRKNAMAMAWHAPLSFEPPLYGAVVAPERFTHGLIVASGAFAVNFLPWEKADLIARVGRVSGHRVDKFRAFAIAERETPDALAPLLADAYAILECRVVDCHRVGDHDLFVGEIVRIHHQEGAFTPQGYLDLNRVHPALYLGRDWYVTTDPASARRHSGR